MLKKLLGILVLFTLPFSMFGEVGIRQNETGYSICPPYLWEDAAFPGQPGKMLVEPDYTEYPAMMTFVTSNRPGTTLDGKWQEGLSALRRFIPGYKSVSTADFTTNKGMKGKKHIYTFQAGEYAMRGVLYTFVSSNGFSITITCGALSQFGNKYDSVFDESVATLEIAR